MTHDKYVDDVASQLARAGISSFEVISATRNSRAFGNAETKFRIGVVILSVVNDRGQGFLHLGAAEMPDELFLLGEIEIAFSWRSLDDVLGDQQAEFTEPEKLESQLARLSEHLEELQAAFSHDRLQLTLARIRRASEIRGRELVERMQRR